MSTAENSRSFLRQYADSDETVEELLEYTRNRFTRSNVEFTTGDSAQIKTYQEYILESESEGAFNVLQRKLVQLQFPVQEGISQSEEYKSATLRGKTRSGEYGLQLLEPEAITLEVYQSPIIGKVPVIIVPNDSDFASMVCALSNRNEPKPIPQSMGASFIKGINNWDRINTLKRRFFEHNPGQLWKDEFQKNIMPNRAFYQDELIILSTKPYSNVTNDLLGFDKQSWRSYSLKIRRAHECAHLFTLKYFGQISNNIHDELIADYAGITSVLGNFESDWFMHFMGLENFPHYRAGGRLQNYIGDLSSDAFRVLQVIVKRASDNLSRFDQTLKEPTNNNDRLNRVKSICRCDLINMAMDDGWKHLLEVYESCPEVQV